MSNDKGSSKPQPPLKPPLKPITEGIEKKGGDKQAA